MMRTQARMIKGGTAFFAAAAITACRSDQDAKVPDSLSVGPLLDTIPIGLAEETNSPESKFPLKGRIAECRGKKECNIVLYGGDILVSLKFEPVYNGHAEISWMGQQGDQFRFRMRVDFNFRDAAEAYQTVEMGQSQKLFNTDLVVTPLRMQNGQVYVKFEH